MLDRDVQLPSQLADIGDAQRANRRSVDGDFAHVAEREGGIRDIGVGDTRQYLSRLRAHEREHRVVRRYIGQRSSETLADVVADPGEVVRRKTGAGDDVVAILGEACDGEVAFDAALAVQ